MKHIHFFLILLLAAALAVSGVYAETAENTTDWQLDYLSRELEAAAEQLLREGEDVEDIYSEISWKSVADTFPVRFDLRERGTVMPVKNQSPWGTCWSFATAAASETSILNSLGMTADEYRALEGEDMDLSEKHLAWFTSLALPEKGDYPEGEYPYNPDQAGEGFHLLDASATETLNIGGNYFLSMTSLSSGIGMLKEKYAPYTAADGSIKKEADWSLPEKDRYAVSFELKDANILPSPAVYDAEGNYVYRPGATEAIKSELLAGRAVGICYLADQSMPLPTKEEQKAAILERGKEQTAVSAEEVERCADLRTGFTGTDGLSKDELREAVLLNLRLERYDEDTYDLPALNRDQLAMILQSAYFGYPFDVIEEVANTPVYMSFIGKDPVIHAQYTYEKGKANHAVTVVGWDDTFAAENWPEDRRPPADGAWIVKNSWGTDWGNGGYFLLSYYDRNLCAIGTFEYVTDESNRQMESLAILRYDNMPAEIFSSTLFRTPVYAANIFEVEEDSVLQFVSAMTGDLDTTVTASVYLLNENAVRPTDGILLETVTDTFRYAGYHRLELSSSLVLPASCRIGITVLENVPAEGKIKYALVNTGSLNRQGAEKYNQAQDKEKSKLDRYATATVNPGESFVSFESGKWMDWTEAIAFFGSKGSNVNIAYDNLPIKAYIYPLDEVEGAHDLSERIPASGGEAAVCPEDGYTVLYPDDSAGAR